MMRRDGTIMTMTDIGIDFGAILLSATSAGFAAYVIFFAPPSEGFQQQNARGQFLASASQGGSDPITTGSIGQISKDTLMRYGSQDQILVPLRYKIRIVAGSLAYIDYIKGDVTYSIEAKVGDTINGFGEIQGIDNRNGRWYLLTDHGLISAEGFVSPP